jgi:hypothetical protein
MLAQEFIFVFNEEGSLYVTRTRKLNDTLAAKGISLDMRPILRMKYETWDALSVGKSTIRLPAHLAATFGRASITAPEFAAEWRTVVAEQTALCETSASLRKPRELLQYLHSRFPSDNWDGRENRYNQAKVELKAIYSAALAVHDRVKASYAEIERMRENRREVQLQMGQHFRATTVWTNLDHEVRSEFGKMITGIDSAIRFERGQIVTLKAHIRDIEQGAAAMYFRAELDLIEREAEAARLELVKNALLTVAGLTHTNHRPSAWWLPMVDSTGEWFRKIASTTRLYTEPLLS